MLSAVSIADTE